MASSPGSCGIYSTDRTRGKTKEDAPFLRCNRIAGSSSSRFEVHASYFDVDDEKIFDLLACRVVEPLLPSSDAEVPYGRAYTAALGLYNMECNSIEDVMRCLEKGLHFHAERRSLDNDKAAAFLDHHTIFQVRKESCAALPQTTTHESHDQVLSRPRRFGFSSTFGWRQRSAVRGASPSPRCALWTLSARTNSFPAEIGAFFPWI